MTWRSIVVLSCVAMASGMRLQLNRDAGRKFAEHSEGALTEDPAFYARFTWLLQLWNGFRLDDITNKFQMYVLNSASASAGMNGSQADFFAASLSNMVYPSVCYAYYTANGTVDFDEARHELNLQASASGMATVFTKLFQFTDSNNDGKFTAGVDQIVDEYPFAEIGWFGPNPKPVWDLGEYVSNSTAKVAKIKTADSVFSLVLKANEKAGSTPGGSSLTPMNTKVDVEINYPNLQPGNKVGLETVVVTTKAEAAAGISTDNGFFVEQPGNLGSLSFTWDTEAYLPGTEHKQAWWNLWTGASNKVAVQASAAAGAQLSDLHKSEFITKHIGVQAHADAGASLEVDRIVFTFDTPKAEKIIWDPTVGAAPERAVDNCGAEVTGAGYRNSAWRRTQKCKCPKGTFIVGSDPRVCGEGLDRYFALGALAGKNCFCAKV